MKIGFVVTAHHSDEYRSNGSELLKRFCDSIFDHVKFDFEIIIVNNGSTKPIEIPDYFLSKWCNPFHQRHFKGCLGRLWPTGEVDYNNLFPDYEYPEYKCDTCGRKTFISIKERKKA